MRRPQHLSGFLPALIQTRLRTILFVVGCVAAAAALREAFSPLLGGNVPFLMYYPAVVFVGWYGGLWPGVIATLLSGAAASYLYLPPVLTFAVHRRADLISLALFTFNGILISMFGEHVRRTERDAQRFAAIVQSSDDAIVAKDLQGVITAWNAGAERLFGFTAAEATGQPITLIIPEDRRAEEAQVIARVRRGQRVDPFETVRRRKDGSLVPVSITVSPVLDRMGEIVGASKIARDITERRRAEAIRAELMQRERQAHDDAVAARDRVAFLAEVGALLTSSLDYEETLDRAVHGALPRLGDYCSVLVEDEHGRLRHAAWGHVDREKERFVRDLTARLLDPDSGAPATAFADAVLKTGRTIVVTRAELADAAAGRFQQIDPETLRLRLQLGTYAYVAASVSVRGRIVGVMAFGTTTDGAARDYTATDVELVEEFARRVSLAIENARLFRHADELNRLKDEFLATLSHEMRTPLAAVLGWARMLASGNLTPEKAAQAVDAIARNAAAQSKIVDDILDVARGMSGNVRLELQPVDLVSVAHRGVEAIAPAAASKQIKVEVRTANAVAITGDPIRLQQVVWNLLSNAVKFTPSGGNVTVEVAAHDGHAELSVADTGVGIPQSFLPYVFDKFRQADGSFTRQYGGLGVGLAIARHLIELHGGSIEARSAGEGTGATFVVRLPRPAPPAA